MKQISQQPKFELLPHLIFIRISLWYKTRYFSINESFIYSLTGRLLITKENKI